MITPDQLNSILKSNGFNNATAAAKTQDQSTGYFDLHVSGLGYLNRVRMVPVKRGDAYLACTISALRGSKGAAEYTTFDVRVCEAKAQEAIKMLEADVKAKKSVIISFKLGDIYPETFVYDKDMGKHLKGDVGVMLKGRLIKVNSAKVDREPVVLPADNNAPEAGTGTNG